MSAIPSEMARPIPQGSILFRERDQLAVGPGPRRTPGIGQQHQRKQSRDFPIVGQEAANRAGEPDRFIREIAALQIRADAAGVAFVEDQVQHVEDGAQPFGPLLDWWACGMARRTS